MKSLVVLMSVFSIGFVTLQSSDAEAGCFAESTIESSNVVMMPEIECLEVEVVANDCQGGVVVEFNNSCEDDAEVERPSKGEDDIDTLSVEPGTTGQDSNAGLADGTEQSVTYAVNVGEEMAQVDVTFTATESEVEGCSVAGSNRSLPASLIALMFLFGFRRSRKV